MIKRSVLENKLRDKYADLVSEREEIKAKIRNGIEMHKDRPIEEMFENVEIALDITWSELNAELNRQLVEEYN